VTGAGLSGWSAPGSAAAGPVTPTGPAAQPGPAGPGAGVAVARGDEPMPTEPPADLGDDGPLAGVGPVGVLGVLDGGFALLRFRFAGIVGVSAVVLLPVQLAELVVALNSGVPSGSDALTTPTSFEVLAASSTTTVWSTLFLVLLAGATTWVGMVVGVLVASWWQGVDLSVTRAAQAAGRRWWVVPVLTAVTLAIKVPATCFLGIGFVVADAFLFTAAVVAGAERLGPFASVARSFDLSRRNIGVALGVVALGLFLTLVIQLVVMAGPLLLGSALGIDGTAGLVVQQASGLVALVTVPLTACFAARAWVEFRCRSEGADLDGWVVRRGLA